MSIMGEIRDLHEYLKPAYHTNIVWSSSQNGGFNSIVLVINKYGEYE